MKSDRNPTWMRIPRGIPQGGDADAPKSGGGARGEPRKSGIRTERNISAREAPRDASWCAEVYSRLKKVFRVTLLIFNRRATAAQRKE